MKGSIKSDHIAVNSYQLLVAGFVPLTFTKISGIEEELEVTDLPDRTVASGGNTKSIEFTAEIPLHHTLEQAAMEVWFQTCQDPVVPLYKKPATLVLKNISGKVGRSFTLLGLFPSKRALPDLEMANEGEMATSTWTFKADDILPI